MVNASVAQLVEQRTENPRVVGSIPTGGTTYADVAQAVARILGKDEVMGSTPIISSIFGPVVQLVRTLACHARGRGFESLPGRHFFC